MVQARVTPTGRYYGAITSTHIAMALAEVTGREVERRWIEVSEPIREPGEYDIMLRFSTEIAATIHITAETEE
jgi:large subunit ribosomal protein L9